jgi:hypothetical protein
MAGTYPTKKSRFLDRAPQSASGPTLPPGSRKKVGRVLSGRVADPRSASADVPPFAAIANSPNFDPKRLAYFPLEPHPKMQQMAISRSAADDIAADIETLKNRHSAFKGGWAAAWVMGQLFHAASAVCSCRSLRAKIVARSQSDQPPRKRCCPLLVLPSRQV